MNAEQFAHTYGARGRKPKWRMRCPVHNGRGMTLAVYDDGPSEPVGLYCHAQCTRDDILAALGITWKDVAPQRQWVDDKSYREAQRKRETEELRASQLRVGAWILRFIESGYTQEDRDRDVAVVCACAWVLSHKLIPHWEVILRTHLERIAAANHCLERGFLGRLLGGKK